jgi:hypothetical protein
MNSAADAGRMDGEFSQCADPLASTQLIKATSRLSMQVFFTVSFELTTPRKSYRAYTRDA